MKKVSRLTQCLRYLESGCDLELKCGTKICMSEEGYIAFPMKRIINCQEEEVLMECSWEINQLIREFNKFSEEEMFYICAGIALSEMRIKKRDIRTK